jgi:hypothetical protein
VVEAAPPENPDAGVGDEGGSQQVSDGDGGGTETFDDIEFIDHGYGDEDGGYLDVLEFLFLTGHTVHALIPGLAGSATAAALTLGYAPAVAAGPVGWIVGVPLIAFVQVATLGGGWGTTVVLFQHEVIPSWKEFFGRD